MLKDETENNATDDILKSVELNENSHIVSMEDAIEFLDIQQKIAPKIALGVSLCILSPVLLIVLFGLSDSGIFGISENLASGAGITVLLVMVAIGVFLFIICNGKAEKYDLLLQQGDYTVNEKKTSLIINRISGIYWPLITAVYLAWSFKTSDWGRTWLIWPVAGVLFGVIETIAKIILKAED